MGGWIKGLYVDRSLSLKFEFCKISYRKSSAFFVRLPEERGGGMNVSIKSFDVEMQVKNKGIEFQVYGNDGVFRGDMIINKSGIIWCEGKTHRKNGVPVKWDDFIEWMNSDD